MAAETIREFLVSMGWRSNEAEQRKFFQGVEVATLKAKLLGDAIEDMARRVGDSLGRAAIGFNDLFNQAKQSGASASLIKDFEFAITKLTGSAAVGADAVAKLVGMGERGFENPGLARAFEKTGFHIDAVTHKMTVNMEALKRFGQMTGVEAGTWRQESGFSPIEMKALQDFAGIQKAMAESAASSKAAGFFPEGAAQDGKDFLATLIDISLKIDDLGKAGLDGLMKALIGPLRELDGFLKDNESEFGQNIKAAVDYIGELTQAGVKAAENGGLGSAIKEGLHEFSSDVRELVGDLHSLVGVLTEVKQAVKPTETSLVDALNAQQNAKPWSIGSWWRKHAPSWLRDGRNLPPDGNMPAPGAHGSSYETGSNGGFFIPGGGAPDGVSIKINGSAVTSGNPLPVSLDTSGFGSSGGGLLGAIGNAIGAGASRLFGGGNGSGGGSDSYGSGSSHVPRAEGVKRAAHLVDHLMSTYGVSRDEAIGAAGVMGYESGDFTTMQEKGQAPGRGGWGYAQWTGPRRRNFFNWFGKSGLKDPSSVDANEGFLDYEIAHGYGRAITALKQQKSVQGAALSWEHVFEGMDGTQGIPAFGAHVGRAVAYSKLPQLQPGYFAGETGGNRHFDNSVSGSHNIINNTIHVDGAQDPSITAHMVGSHVNRTSRDIVRNLSGPAQ